MEHAAAQDVGDLPPEYHAVLAARYDGDAILQQVLEASKANEDRAFPNLHEAIVLTGMVAGHLASLPRSPPLHCIFYSKSLSLRARSTLSSLLSQKTLFTMAYLSTLPLLQA
jgi:hypothetical protein